MSRSNIYANSGFDRAAELRNDEARLARHLRDGTAHLIPVWRQRNFFREDDAFGMATLAASAYEHLVAAPEEAGWDHVFLGLRSGQAYFALNVGHIEAPETDSRLAAHGRFEDLRSVGPLLNQGDASILAYARGIAYWHDRHRYCGVCGAMTLPRTAGHKRQCTNPDCATEHFPRTDPAVIMLIHDRDRVVMGRAPRFPKGMHSVLAGFVEPGESLEDTVAREVLEEVGVTVTDIKYFSSQPWPFPASLMIGFTARATSFDLTPQEDELESARWYTRAELEASPEDENFRLPRKDAIARRLLEAWLRDEIA